MIIDHTNIAYERKWHLAGDQRHNGAYYYSKEIVENIIPLVKTDRNWVTVNVKGGCMDHSIVFIHNNVSPEKYDWLSEYNDLILVCGIPETVKKVKHLGKAIYLPLSVDVDEVKSYKTKKTKEICYAGRSEKIPFSLKDKQIDFLTDMPRPLLLKEMAKYKKVYAVGRVAIEAKILGCEILPYDPRFPDVSRWEVLGYKDAAKILQEKINEIDHKTEETE